MRKTSAAIRWNYMALILTSATWTLAVERDRLFCGRDGYTVKNMPLPSGKQPHSSHNYRTWACDSWENSRFIGILGHFQWRTVSSHYQSPIIWKEELLSWWPEVVRNCPRRSLVTWRQFWGNGSTFTDHRYSLSNVECHHGSIYLAILENLLVPFTLIHSRACCSCRLFCTIIASLLLSHIVIIVVQYYYHSCLPLLLWLIEKYYDQYFQDHIERFVLLFQYCCHFIHVL